jgi:hypothetical protein
MKDQNEPTQTVTPVASDALFAEPEPLLGELVFYGAHNYGNHIYCGKCGSMCARWGCPTCDESGKIDDEPCEDCLGGECFYCDECEREIEGWLPEGQHAPIPSANVSAQTPPDSGTQDHE